MNTPPTILRSVIIIFLLATAPGWLRAQNTVFSYQGNVLVNGTPFTGTGQFQFALVTSTNSSQTAMATANAPSGGFITGYAVTVAGNGYVTAPTVTVSGGGGSGATATAHVSSGAVTSISVNSPGNGNYTSTPTVTIAPPQSSLSYTSYWSNDGTSVNGSEPTASISLGVTNGLFTVVMGDTTVANMATISAALFDQPNLQLRIWFNDGTHGFSALSPPQNLTAVPYATFATTASNFSGTVSASQLTSIGNTNIGASGNFFIGVSGNSTTTGYNNTASGNSALQANTSGFYNTANGSDALLNNTSGHFNTANGSQALFSNTIGDDNTASGLNALYSTTTGSLNTGIGTSALQGNTIGNYNTAIGYAALFNNTNGNNNIALGNQAGSNITTGSFNIDIGNPGVATDSNVIRIGSGQSQTYLVGALTINGTTIINASGNWVGSPTGLVGPQGPAGPQGATGAQGPQGPAGPAVHTSAVCSGSYNINDLLYYCQNVVCSSAAKTIAAVAAPCSVTSDSGSCTASLTSNVNGNFGICCVCSP